MTSKRSKKQESDDYYDILGVPRDADDKAIKTAYRYLLNHLQQILNDQHKHQKLPENLP